ncbi:hypothetical protein HT102_01650 [Hoyosella sp. G463]|uniref:Uncharacterized protein n=1 Tax=Lolliginicoccus lacisalsi TaxID=2742202 RepID=A0A927J9T9_9ACTN|nr:hypothetical protein [Lolliginicoccus lacisalsi]MBD8505195.1 hypothetical protein [Lolliginicoccus lacisalsi]
MTASTAPGFVIDDLSLDPYAHGFGQTPDGRTFTFQVRNHLLHVEVYRPGLSTTVPDTADVAGTADLSIVDIDVADERSVIAAVRDAVTDTEHRLDHLRVESPLSTWLHRITSLLDRREPSHARC